MLVQDESNLEFSFLCCDSMRVCPAGYEFKPNLYSHVRNPLILPSLGFFRMYRARLFSPFSSVFSKLVLDAKQPNSWAVMHLSLNFLKLLEIGPLLFPTFPRKCQVKGRKEIKHMLCSYFLLP